VFAFFAAGVTIEGLSGLVEALTDTVALGIVAGLVVGKILGISAWRSSWHGSPEPAWTTICGGSMC
jgi:Na+/H+ antiporter NhaA